MQQFFCDRKPKIQSWFPLESNQEHHARRVLRLEQETVRLVYEGEAFLAKCGSFPEGYGCFVESRDPTVNELKQSITLCMALIKKEKFEWVLQKVTELGVSRIVPFESSRTIVKVQKEKQEKVLNRYQQIVLEASQQCKRNRVPIVEPVVSLKQLIQYRSDQNVVAYEALHQDHAFFDSSIQASTTIVIGPEGGFSLQEIDQLNQMGYKSISLGNRILRAETAAIFSLSVLAMKEI